MNSQSAEPRTLRADGVLEIFEIFKTIQGEGPYTGHPATFIRLAGCNLQCPGCDTDYTSERHTMEPSDILARIERDEYPPQLVVITGGEPFRQNLTPLARLLLDHDYQVQVETNGVYAPPENLPGKVAIVCSPKTHKVHKQTAKAAVAYKYVMKAGSVDSDGLPISALDHKVRGQVARPLEYWSGPIYLQPMDEKDVEKNRRNTQACVDSCLKHGYTLQLQIHKIIGVE